MTDVSRREFLAGATVLAVSPMVAESWTGGKVLMAREAPRQPIKLEGHKTWECVRPHMLGHLSLDEMAMGLPGPWQEYLASWWVEGAKVFVPTINVESEDFCGAKLNSGFKISLGGEDWKPFIEKWQREIAIPLYGHKCETHLGVAILTNISLFRMAQKYWKRPD